MDEGKFCAYARRIEAGYNSTNPYHNRSGSVLVVSLPRNCVMLFHDTKWKKKRAAQARPGPAQLHALLSLHLGLTSMLCGQTLLTNLVLLHNTWRQNRLRAQP